MPHHAPRHASFQEVLAQLGDADYKVRRKAVRALAKGYGSQALSTLIQAPLMDRRSEVRLEAVRVLSELKDTRAVDALMARLGDSSRRVRELAAGTLGELGNRKAVQPLLDSLHDSHPRYVVSQLEV
jgi:HEAT repeat protein